MLSYLEQMPEQNTGNSSDIVSWLETLITFPSSRLLTAAAYFLLAIAACIIPVAIIAIILKIGDILESICRSLKIVPSYFFCKIGEVLDKNHPDEIEEDISFVFSALTRITTAMLQLNQEGCDNPCTLSIATRIIALMLSFAAIIPLNLAVKTFTSYDLASLLNEQNDTHEENRIPIQLIIVFIFFYVFFIAPTFIALMSIYRKLKNTPENTEEENETSNTGDEKTTSAPKTRRERKKAIVPTKNTQHKLELSTPEYKKHESTSIHKNKLVRGSCFCCSLTNLNLIPIIALSAIPAWNLNRYLNQTFYLDSYMLSDMEFQMNTGFLIIGLLFICVLWRQNNHAKRIDGINAIIYDNYEAICELKADNDQTKEFLTHAKKQYKKLINNLRPQLTENRAKNYLKKQEKKFHNNVYLKRYYDKLSTKLCASWQAYKIFYSTLVDITKTRYRTWDDTVLTVGEAALSSILPPSRIISQAIIWGKDKYKEINVRKVAESVALFAKSTNQAEIVFKYMALEAVRRYQSNIGPYNYSSLAQDHATLILKKIANGVFIRAELNSGGELVIVTHNTTLSVYDLLLDEPDPAENYSLSY